jgi:glycosyltransferase involved in cell wall biosynthesis
MRILYVNASWVAPAEDPRQDRFFLLSEHTSEQMEGDVLQPIWFQRPEQVEAQFGPGSYPTYARGKFHYHWFLAFQHSGWRQRLRWFWFYIRTGVRIHRERRFDCIVVYSHMMPALAAVAIKLWTRAKLIVEIATSPDLSYLYDPWPRTIANRVGRIFSDLSLNFTVLMSDRVHLLYRSQLAHYPRLRRVPASVFHEFVLLSLIPEAVERERSVLLVGAPWYLKGVDLLIEAFKKIEAEFPDVTVKIQGHFEDKHRVEELIAGSPRIELVKAVLNPETLQRISRATVVVLPSRCEGMGRVLLEAMGAGVPVIGSTAGGIPHYVRHGENGLVFESGNADELSSRLRELLGNRELCDRLGANGRELALAEYTEKAYIDQFVRMIESTVPPELRPSESRG